MTYSSVLNLQSIFVIIHCCKCGMSFAVPDDIRQRLLDTGAEFFCPKGHSQHYTESTVQILEKKLKREQKSKEWAEQRANNNAAEIQRQKNQVRAQKAAKTRLKNRIKKGACPCCNKTFVNLKRHITTQHPEYLEGSDNKNQRSD